MPRHVRQVKVKGNIAIVPLTRGYEAIIDLCDMQLIEGWNWTAFVRPHTVYAMRTTSVLGKAKTIYMHRVIMGAPSGLQVDHVDRNGLNNRRQNLRLATSSQNMMNGGLRSDNTSGVKGVSFRKDINKWRAAIMINKKTKVLGHFDTRENAYDAYCAASLKFHGEYGSVS